MLRMGGGGGDWGKGGVCCGLRFYISKSSENCTYVKLFHGSCKFGRTIPPPPVPSCFRTEPTLGYSHVIITIDTRT